MNFDNFKSKAFSKNSFDVFFLRARENYKPFPENVPEKITKLSRKSIFFTYPRKLQKLLVPIDLECCRCDCCEGYSVVPVCLGERGAGRGEGRGKREERRGKREGGKKEGRGKREERRGKREEGREKREEGRGKEAEKREEGRGKETEKRDDERDTGGKGGRRGRQGRQGRGERGGTRARREKGYSFFLLRIQIRQNPRSLYHVHGGGLDGGYYYLWKF
jgi:hypothetical protein